MEKKTIGQFIAALRKAGGMTQKDLAEKLNVSDKAVSRWERDENAPDLSLIPVIAEIFGVTSDEILRGERAGAREVITEGNSEKGKKQIAHLLEKSKTKFQMHSLIAIGIASAGLLAAMICNFGFLRAHLGFYIACVFFVAALICESVFFISAKAAIDADDVEEDILVSAKGYIAKWLVGTYIAIITMFAFCLPLVTEVWDAYWGLQADAWFAEGLLIASVAGFGGMLILWILSSENKGRNLFSLSEDKIKKNRLKLRSVKITAIVLGITAIAHIVVNVVAVESQYFAKGTTFDNYEDFVEYIETPYIYYGGGSDSIILDEENSEAIDEMFGERLEDSEGNLLCEYRWLNEEVSEIDWGKEEDGYLPVTVYTHWEISNAKDVFNFVWTVVYIMEVAGGVFSYFKRRNK